MISVAVVGGGFGGVGALVMLRRAGYRDVTVFERSDRVGGVWNHNVYPGAACDVPSHLYEFSFAPNPRWSRRFSPQPEIQAYLEDTARSHGVLDRIRTRTDVTAARWDGDRAKWIVQTSAGQSEFDVLVTACGQLSVPRMPEIDGVETFAGPAFHTSRWQRDVELAGRDVAVIGTGASAIQVVPAIQPQVGRLTVYQRSPGWTVPRGDFAYSERAKRAFERFPILQRADRQANFAFHDLGAAAMTTQQWLLPPFKAVGKRQINKAIADPELRRKLTPRDQVGCKRIMLTDDWYPALAQPNVEVVDQRIDAITATGVTSGGRARAHDVLIFATGFQTHGFVAPMEIVGREGRSLAETWTPTARAYLGCSVPGFPNLFLVYGPNTNGGTGSVIYTIEAGITHLIAGLRELERTRSRSIEVRAAVAEAFDEELRAALQKTVWHSGCTNWYVDREGNDPNQWPWLWSTYRRRTANLSPGAYELVA